MMAPFHIAAGFRSPHLSILLLALSMVLPSAAVPPTRFDTIAGQADAARTANHVPDAIRLYREATRLKPAWSDGWWYLGSLFYDLDRFSEAAAAFRHLLDDPRYRGSAHAFVGLCEYETGQYDDALAQFRAWAGAGWAGTPELRTVGYYHFSLLLTREGKFTQSLALITWLVPRLGDNAELTEAMGLASLRIHYLPENCPPELRERVWLSGKAALYAQMAPRQFEPADEFAARLVARYGGQPEVHAVRAMLYEIEDKKAEAEVEYREELKISPDHVPALVALAEMDLDKGETAEARVFAQKAIDAETNHAEAHHLLGRVFLANRDLAASVKELETARQLAPKSAGVRAHLAMVYGRLGRIQEAKAESAAYIELKNKADAAAALRIKSQGQPAIPAQDSSSETLEKTN